ncbi:hypothetical protein B0I37DRAFT_429793 [Chaetomium sp. MPI-CAGE-AT-0009]|nr:hypothetical protein B0I37DRAFT_429793 [Chaetomium sp. MPI-CAGE-AT-0009]
MAYRPICCQAVRRDIFKMANNQFNIATRIFSRANHDAGTPEGSAGEDKATTKPSKASRKRKAAKDKYEKELKAAKDNYEKELKVAKNKYEKDLKLVRLIADLRCDKYEYEYCNAVNICVRRVLPSGIGLGLGLGLGLGYFIWAEGDTTTHGN